MRANARRWNFVEAGGTRSQRSEDKELNRQNAMGAKSFWGGGPGSSGQQVVVVGISSAQLMWSIAAPCAKDALICGGWCGELTTAGITDRTAKDAKNAKLS